MVKLACGHLEVLRDHTFRGMRKPIGEQESLVLVKRSISEDEKELGAFVILAVKRVVTVARTERLDGVRHSRGEVP